ncbi:hypothetical protein [Pandoraea fibrosis]|uniref:hypothetical protein n=1 Tax=Pandoraea fibrosis TaxID=1891094 RepID=UPI000574F3B4|nr:hypothetical protein [Pandoraea fibrosis]
MLSPHEIATLLLAAASLGPIDADALEPPDLAALEQARLVHVDVDEGQAKVIVTEDGHRVLRRLGLERSVGERPEAPRLKETTAQRADRTAGMGISERSAPANAAAGETVRELQQAAALPADVAMRSERREEQA